MMKKLITLLMMSILAIGVGWAGQSAFYTLDGTLTGGSIVYDTESDITQDSVSWKVTGNTTMSPWRIGGKSLSNVDRDVYSTTAMGSTISKIELQLGQITCTLNSVKLTVASDASFNNVLDQITKSSVSENSTLEFVPTSGSEWAKNAYYKFTFNVTCGSSSNTYVQLTKATFYKNPPSNVATPVISGVTPFVRRTEVSITCETAGASLYYTTDGSDPTTSSTLYTAPFTINETTTVKAIAYDANNNASSVASKEFVKNAPSALMLEPMCASQDANNVKIELQLVNSSSNLIGFNIEVAKQDLNGNYCSSIQWVKDDTDGTWAGFSGYGHTILARWEGATDAEREANLYDYCDLKSNIKSNNLVIIEILSTMSCRFFPVLEQPVGVARFTLDMSACEDGDYRLFIKNVPGCYSFDYAGGEEGTGAYTPNEPVILELTKVGNTVTSMHKKYAVTLADVENGVVTADKTEAEEGEAVTLIVTPNEGYELAMLTYTVEGQEPVAIENFTFNMPAAPVTINATFRLKADGISIYVKANQAPYLYAWYDNISQCGEWPGTLLSEKVTINREQYYMYHFDLGMINVIFNNGYGGQTGDFTNITKDAFFIYDGNDLAYGLIPPEVYGNSEGEYAFFVNTDGWEQVYAVVDGNTYPMTKVGVDGAGFEVYKWEVPNIDFTSSTITFNNGAGSGIQDVNGNIYTSEYVKGGYYVYSFFLNHSVVRLDRVTTILYDDSSQRPAIEDCSITMNSTKDVWNGLSSIEFQIRGTYFSQQARQGSVWYSVDNRDWVEFTSLLNSEQQFDENIIISFVRNHSVHGIRLAAKDLSGALSNVVTVLEAIDAQNLSCNNLPDAEYTGQAITFDPAISDMNGTELVLNEDYTFTISDNVNAGNAILDIQANYPRYIGYQRLYFNISPHTIAGLITLSDGDSYCYTGYPITPEVEVYDQTFGTLTVNQDYVVSYLDNENVGTGVVVIDGIGNFTGHFELSFEIVDIVPGDVDLDGVVNIADLTAMLNIIFYNDDYVAVADMNKDRIINVQDVVGLVHLLLTGDIPHFSPNVRRAPKNDYAAHASLYWQDGTLYLDSPVPVAAVNIINDVDNHITWNLDSYGMVVMQDSGEHGMHSVLFSFDRGVIPPGVNPIATTDCQSPSVVGAELCDPESRLINVQLNENLSGIADIRKTAGINCDMSGSKLVINCDAALHDVDINVYTIDGMVVDNRHLPMLNSGTTFVEMSDLFKSNRFMIIAVLRGGQVLATQILTQK